MSVLTVYLDLNNIFTLFIRTFFALYTNTVDFLLRFQAFK